MDESTNPSNPSSSNLLNNLLEPVLKISGDHDPEMQPSTNCSTTPLVFPQLLSSSPPSKKSARLAEKRKLREEAGPVPNQDEEFYFTPYKSCRVFSPVRSETANSKIIRKDYNVNYSSYEQQSTSSSTSLPPEQDNLNRVEFSEDDAIIAKLGTGTGFGDDSSEEDKWFDTLDVGKLEGVVDIDDISTTGRLLTERQKSFIFKKDTGFSIDIDGMEEDVDIPKEASANVRTRKEKSERRRVLANMKKEYDKKRTVDRLLKKPQAKQGKGNAVKPNNVKTIGPMITMIKRRDINSISFPIGVDVSVFGGLTETISTSTLLRSLPPATCGVHGCLNLKKYSCSKTNIPLCSLECYKKNLTLSNDK